MYYSHLRRVLPAGPVVLRYRGTLGEVLNSYSCILEKGMADGHLRDGDVIDLFLHPARILRGAIDYNVAVHGMAESCVVQSLRLAERSALGEFGLGKLAKLRGMLNRYGGALDTIVDEPSDYVTWRWSSPRASYQTAKRIFNSPQRKGRDVLLITSAHGAVRAGIDVCNFYRAFAQRDDAAILDVVRFSRRKKADAAPFISEDARERLRRAGYGRAIVVFDEDLWTGATAAGLQIALKELFPSKTIYAEGNYHNAVLRKYIPDYRITRA